ncbi:uncharacterized protein LOC127425043 [Myxocyprinus asiaticus]|uniref:uncharacterized protein LOC127425043 n=1 Tax=Myxocyprinus asiaticus TaxID=70543 RepID=UPI002223B230|nr:uncharacterized protein LOC127425043 [Myxocyprinus asiaticus]
MSIFGVAVISTLLCSVWSSTIKAKDEHRTAFFGEDIHIPVPALDTTEVMFKPRVEPLSERVLLRNRDLLNPRAKLNTHISQLILEDVGEEDEGTYVVKNSLAPADVRRIILIVRDCALETVVKYGDTYHIPINPTIGPYTLEFRYGGQTNVNQTTDAPPVLLFNRTAFPMEEYENRLTVNEKRVNLHLVTGADEGSYTIVDSDGKVKMRACLNVKDHQIFEHLSYGGTLKIKLHVDHTKVKMVYIPDTDHKEQLILDQGELVLPLDPALEGRVSVEGSLFFLKKVKVSDMGVFRVMDFSGFRIADVYLHVESYKLPQFYVAIISLLSLLAFLLLVCLLSCLIRVHRRAERERKITLIAQQAGKGDGEAFRQVVSEAYTRFAEDSTMQSTWENNTESTEVEIKGLEVSKPGQYQALPSDKNFLEVNDSGVEFNSSTLPLDSDTDVPDNFTSHKLLLESDTLAGVPPAISEGDHSATRTPDSVLSASPVVHPKSGAQTDGNLIEATIPEGMAKANELEAKTSKDASPLSEKVITLDPVTGTTT